jgi:hypothetical protein
VTPTCRVCGLPVRDEDNEYGDGLASWVHVGEVQDHEAEPDGSPLQAVRL